PGVLRGEAAVRVDVVDVILAGEQGAADEQGEQRQEEQPEDGPAAAAGPLVAPVPANVGGRDGEGAGDDRGDDVGVVLGKVQQIHGGTSGRWQQDRLIYGARGRFFSPEPSKSMSRACRSPESGDNRPFQRLLMQPRADASKNHPGRMRRTQRGRATGGGNGDERSGM